jgi:hypothetical protein
MTLENLGNIGEFVGAIAVILSLVYLGVQIRQNTRTVRASTYQDIVRLVQEIDLLLASDPELNRIWVAGRRDPAKLDDDEQRRFSTLIVIFYRNLENAYYQRQNKLIDERIYRAWVGYSLRLSSQPGMLQWWHWHRGLLSEEFQRFVERELAAQQSTGVDPVTQGINGPL